MKYQFNYKVGPYRRASTVITSNEVVVWATPAFQWALTRTIGEVIQWAELKRITWECVGTDWRPPT